MSTIGVYDPEPGTCFRIYRAAELLYRLAAIGGNLRALEEDVPENEYLNEPEFEDWIWKSLRRRSGMRKKRRTRDLVWKITGKRSDGGQNRQQAGIHPASGD